MNTFFKQCSVAVYRRCLDYYWILVKICYSCTQHILLRCFILHLYVSLLILNPIMAAYKFLYYVYLFVHIMCIYFIIYTGWVTVNSCFLILDLRKYPVVYVVLICLFDILCKVFPTGLLNNIKCDILYFFFSFYIINLLFIYLHCIQLKI